MAARAKVPIFQNPQRKVDVTLFQPIPKHKFSFEALTRIGEASRKRWRKRKFKQEMIQLRREMAAQDPNSHERFSEMAKRSKGFEGHKFKRSVIKLLKEKGAEPWKEGRVSGFKDKHHSPDSIKKMKKSLKGKPKSPDAIKNMELASRKKAKDPEFRRRLRSAKRSKGEDYEIWKYAQDHQLMAGLNPKQIKAVSNYFDGHGKFYNSVSNSIDILSMNVTEAQVAS